MSKLLVATTNLGKQKEFEEFLRPHSIETVSLSDLKIEERPIEDGETFAENSLLKANFYWQKSGLPTLTDDGGFEIDALGGAPGVHSHRFGGIELSESEIIQAMLRELKNVPPDRRTARIHGVVTLRVSQDRNFQAEASTEGLVRESDLSPKPGLPYRAILWIPSYNKFYSQLTEKELSQENHRYRALEQILPYIKQYV